MIRYEGIIILQPKVTVENVERIMDEITHIVGELEETNLLGIKKLAYEVKGNKEGYYINFYFNTEKENVVELEKYYREEDNVIKFITIYAGE